MTPLIMPLSANTCVSICLLIDTVYSYLRTSSTSSTSPLLPLPPGLRLVPSLSLYPSSPSVQMPITISCLGSMCCVSAVRLCVGSCGVIRASWPMVIAHYILYTRAIPVCGVQFFSRACLRAYASLALALTFCGMHVHRTQILSNQYLLQR
jgi:hypothetical protein